MRRRPARRCVCPCSRIQRRRRGGVAWCHHFGASKAEAALPRALPWRGSSTAEAALPHAAVRMRRADAALALLHMSSVAPHPGIPVCLCSPASSPTSRAAVLDQLRCAVCKQGRVSHDAPPRTRVLMYGHKKYTICSRNACTRTRGCRHAHLRHVHAYLLELASPPPPPNSRLLVAPCRPSPLTRHTAPRLASLVDRVQPSRPPAK